MNLYSLVANCVLYEKTKTFLDVEFLITKLWRSVFKCGAMF